MFDKCTLSALPFDSPFPRSRSDASHDTARPALEETVIIRRATLPTMMRVPASNLPGDAELTDLPITPEAHAMLRTLQAKYGTKLEGRDSLLGTFLRLILVGPDLYDGEDAALDVWLSDDGTVKLMTEGAVITPARALELMDALHDFTLLAQAVKGTIDEFNLQQLDALVDA